MPPRTRSLLFWLCLASLAGCAKPPAEPRDAQAAPILVGEENLVRVTRQVIRAGPRVAGRLDPREQARVRAEIGGSVTWEAVGLGRRVKPGQVLVRIEDAALTHALASARSALSAARVDLYSAGQQLARTRRLVQAGALSTRDLEVAQTAHTGAEARVAQARAQVSQAKQQLEGAVVSAPIAGVISEDAVNQGDVVAPGAPLFTVIDPSSMRLEAAVPSEDLPALDLGTRVDFEVRGFPGEIFTGRIEQIAPAVDPDTRQITTLVTLPNPGGKLLAGLFAEGRIGATVKKALVVPTAALNLVDHPPSLMRVTNGRVERVPVTLGLDDPQTERVEIRGPVNEGDLVLTGAAKDIAPGSPVAVTAPTRAAVN